MKIKRIAALLLVSVLSVSVLVPQAFAATDDSKTSEEKTTEETVEKSHHGKKESVAEPEGAIGKDAAKEKALADAGVTAEDAGKVRSHVSRAEDGTVIYKVHFTYDGQWYSYKIDATTGEILDKGTKDASAESEKKTIDSGKRGKKESVAEPDGAIGKDAAKEKALADAGVTAEDAGKVRSRVSQTEDGTVIYKVRFTYDGQRYSYQINATTGEILDKNTKDASEITEEHSGKRGKREGMPKTETKTETTVPTA